MTDAGEDQPLVCIVDDAAVTATQIINNVPVTSTGGSCRILDLVVDLNQLT